MGIASVLTMCITESASLKNQMSLDTFRREGATWLFVGKTLLAFFLTGWIAMRFALPQPSTAMLTTVLVANRQSGMVLAKSFYRAIGTLVGAIVAVLIVAAFAQQRELYLASLSLWVGLCTAGAPLHRNFKSYAFVLSGYTATIIVMPVIGNPLAVFDAAVARVSEVLLGLLVSAVISENIFPSRVYDVLQREMREQFIHFMGFIQKSTHDSTTRADVERAAIRFVRDAVTLEDMRSSVIFENQEARSRSGHLMLFNQQFMATSISLLSMHHLLNRLRRHGREIAVQTLTTLYAPLGEALSVPFESNEAARALLPNLGSARKAMTAHARELRLRLSGDDQRDFDTGATLLNRLTEELQGYVNTAAVLRQAGSIGETPERIRFVRSNDYTGSVLALVRTTLAMLALSAFWISSNWTAGASAMMMTAVFSGLFAISANPAKTANNMFIGFLSGMMLCLLCVFLVLPSATTYSLVVISIAPFLVIGLAMQTRPRTAGYGIGCAMGFVMMLGLKNPMVFDPQQFFNEMIAQVIGLMTASASFIIVPTTLGSQGLRRRQFDRLRSQVRFAAKAPLKGIQHRFNSFNHDLIHQIVSQTESSSRDAQLILSWTLSVHEMGAALIQLRRDMATRHLTPETADIVSVAIQAVSYLFDVPSVSTYKAARNAVEEAIAFIGSHETNRPLMNHLNLLRLSLLDEDSALACYMLINPVEDGIKRGS